MIDKYEIIPLGIMGAGILAIAGAVITVLDLRLHNHIQCPLEQTISVDIDNNGMEEKVAVGFCNFEYWVFPDSSYYSIYIEDGQPDKWCGELNKKPSNLRAVDDDNDGFKELLFNVDEQKYRIENVQGYLLEPRQQF